MIAIYIKSLISIYQRIICNEGECHLRLICNFSSVHVLSLNAFSEISSYLLTSN